MSFFNYIKGEEPGFFEKLPHALQGKGHYGEYLTDYALNNDNLPGKLCTFCNVLVPRVGKATGESELDVLMLHEKGIYILESKNYSGWIFGSEDQLKWTMSLNAHTKEHFYNPIKQNRGHVKALAAYLGLPESAFMSFIVFSERCELKDVPFDGEGFHVCRRHHLVRDMKRDLEKREVLFGDAEFQAVKAKLDGLKAGSTKEALQEHIEEAKAVQSGKVCPYCGSDLVERHRKSDGGVFIGCSAFPKCRYTRSAW